MQLTIDAQQLKDEHHLTCDMLEALYNQLRVRLQGPSMLERIDALLQRSTELWLQLINEVLPLISAAEQESLAACETLDRQALDMHARLEQAIRSGVDAAIRAEQGRLVAAEHASETLRQHQEMEGWAAVGKAAINNQALQCDTHSGGCTCFDFDVG